MKEHYLLGEVSRVLGRKPHQIVHLLTTAGRSPSQNKESPTKDCFQQRMLSDSLAISG